MSQRHLIVAVGHTWPTLEVERAVLEAGDIVLVDGRDLSRDSHVWNGVEGVLLGSAVRIDAVRLGEMPACRGIVRYGMGFDNVDVETATMRGVVVCNVRDYCVDEVAEHVLAFAFSCARELSHWDRNVRAGVWRGPAPPKLRRIASSCLGIVGYGLIGRRLAQKSLGLFARVIVCDPWVEPDPEDLASGIIFERDLSALVSAADIVSLHVPLTSATRHLIDSAALARMKQDAVLINASRGGLVDEQALIATLESGALRAAALDTFSSEPIAADHALLRTSRLLLSPHVAWLSEQAESELRASAAFEIRRIIQGEAPLSPVNLVARPHASL
ncbi:MAG: C-terminal binding protein [Burkholderiales bacterium]